MSGMSLSVLPVGVQDFVKLRQMGAVYVDKTPQLCRMIERAPLFTFFSRPRRFGKSLMLTAMQELYLGHRELFAGTWAYDNYDFPPHKVIFIDFTKIDSNAESFRDVFLTYMKGLGSSHGVNLDDCVTPGQAFGKLVEQLGADAPVVVSVDEYDRPLVDNISRPEAFKVIQEILQNFYVVLKGNNQFVAKCVMTGISQFGKLSIFSGANQFVNVTLWHDYATLCGYTRAELEQFYPDHIAYAQQASGYSEDLWWDQLKYWYNGYSWDINALNDESVRVFCPFTVLSYFSNPARFEDYWYQSARPSLVMEVLASKRLVEPFDMDQALVSTRRLVTLDPVKTDTVGLLFQSGYLTLVADEPDDGTAVIVGYPNREIRSSFTAALLANYAEYPEELGDPSGIAQAARSGNWDQFFTLINRTLAGISYENFHRHEHYVHSIVHGILDTTSLQVYSQRHTNRGRFDLELSYIRGGRKHFIIIEFKTSATAGISDDDLAKDYALALQALDQIHAHGYTGSYIDPVCIGATINPAIRTITAWVVEPVQPSTAK